MSPPISLEDAIATVLAQAHPLAAEEIALANALDRVLAEDVVAAGDVPPFANSAMDGFAITTARAGDVLEVVGESRAGAPSDAFVTDATALRISTGAPLPPGAGAVVQMERSEPVDETHVRITEATTPGQNIRRAGEDLRAGDTVLRAGVRLGPAAIGAAVNAGRGFVRVTRRPRVAIVTTGDELVEPGEPLSPGQIHGSNALTIGALVKRAGGVVTLSTGAADTAEQTRTALAAALTDADMVLVSGGISVGPHDHVKPALAQLGAQEHFWRVALRPGGPLWFGTLDDTLIFGLPGNPVSSMVTFLLLARPALHALGGLSDTAAAPRTAALTEPAPRSEGRVHAVRVRLSEGDRLATPTGPQGSHILTSMLQADGLALISPGEGDAPAGEHVPVVRI